MLTMTRQEEPLKNVIASEAKQSCGIASGNRIAAAAAAASQ
jgi:hypothetical protein